MRKLTRNLCIGLTLVLLLGWVVRVLFDPSPYYGNDILAEKMQQYGARSDSFNTVFIGSSIVLHNIDPFLFDSLVPAGLGVSSYNLGSGGTLPPETYRFYQTLLKEHGGHLKYVFIELRDIGYFQPHHLHTLRKRYWMNPADYSFVVRSNLLSGIPVSHKRSNIRYYGISLLERMFIINYFNDIYGVNKQDGETREFKRQLVRKADLRGYLPLEGRSSRREQFLMDTTNLALMAQTYRNIKAEAKNLRANPLHVKRILDLIKLSEQHGVHCYLFLQPKQEMTQLRETIALLPYIPGKNLINVADPDLAPELYFAENSFSAHHLNVAGTRILTERLVEAFKVKLREEANR